MRPLFHGTTPRSLHGADRMERHHIRLLLAAGATLALLAAPSASAGHGGDPVTLRATYEVGPLPGVWTCIPGSLLDGCDPTGLSQDGSIDAGGARWFPDEVPEGVDVVQASIVDDVWGANVIAANLFTCAGGNAICGDEEQGEVSVIFCGTSPPVDIPAAPAWEQVGVFLGYAVWQYTVCDFTDAPTGATTGGVLDPAGGIFVTFG